MRKIFVLLVASMLIVSCKKEQQVVGTDAQGNQLTVNESGDTLKIEETITDIIPEGNSSLTQDAEGGYTFRYNLKKGETYPFLLKINMNESLSDGTQSEKTTSSKTTEMSYRVDEVVGNNYKITATFKGFSESFTAPTGEKLAYNTSSAKPADKDAAQSWEVYKSISGESFKMEIDNKGKVLGVTGLDAVISKAQSKLKSSFTAEESKMIGDLLKGSLSPEMIIVQFEETFNFFPDKNMKVGEDWSDSQNISEGPIKGTNTVTRTFKGINGNTATIAVSGNLNVNGKDTQNNMTMTVSSKATLKGNITFDVNSGWIQKVDLTKTENNTQTIEGQGQKQSITQNATTQTTVN